VHFIDGLSFFSADDGTASTSLNIDTFGETGDYGEWKPKEVSGVTYGDNGFYLDFADSGALGDDESGESNDFTVTNLVASDQMLDSPTNNFATMNLLDRSIDNSTVLTEGNLKCVQDYVSDARTVRATMGNSTGKWYFECLIVAGGDGVWSHGDIGILNVADDIDRNNVHLYDTGWWHENQGQTYNGASAENTSLSAVGGGDIVQVAYDLDASKIWFGRNNTWILSGDPAAGSNETYDNLSGTLAPACDMMESNSNGTLIFNFGQDSSFAAEETAQGETDSNGYGDFYYEPPTDFLALCTANLDTPAVTPSEHFNTVLWTGAGADQAITGVGFQPDFVWIKCRSTTMNHYLNDAVRGQGKTVFADGIWAEYDYGATQLESFDSDGFTVDDDGAYVNASGETFVGWNWKANGAGSSNTDGDMAETVTVSANVDAGFSIVTYTGDGSAATVGHGLSKAPELIIIKNRSVEADDWAVYHSSNTAAPETDYLFLSTTAATADDAAMWNDTAPSATVFTVGTNHSVNADDETYIAYCFHSVDGYSKVGSYTGNQNADGTFIYTGFRPALVIAKNATATENWTIQDSARSPYNAVDIFSRPDGNNVENNDSGTPWIDFLSNGFKIRNADTKINDSDETFIYLAFAETPFKYSNAR